MSRLIIISVFFLFSLLTVFKAPTFHLWLLAIIVSEFPLIFVFCTALLLLWGVKVEKYQLAGTLIGIAALAFYLNPIIRAYFVSKELREVFLRQEKSSFSPFSLWTMLSRRNKGNVEPKIITYVTYRDIALHLDFFPSAQAGKRPCVIVVHGG